MEQDLKEREELKIKNKIMKLVAAKIRAFRKEKDLKK